MPSLKESWNMIKDCKEAQRQVTDKAARLLGINHETHSQYFYTNDLANFFKDHSSIDYFLLNGLKHYPFEVKNMTSHITDSILMNIYPEFIEHNPEKIDEEEATREQVYEWALTYVP